MKKSIATVLLALSVLTVTACGDDPAEPVEQDDSGWMVEFPDCDTDDLYGPKPDPDCGGRWYGGTRSPGAVRTPGSVKTPGAVKTAGPIVKPVAPPPPPKKRR
jgi:hypothetical protein